MTDTPEIPVLPQNPFLVRALNIIGHVVVYGGIIVLLYGIAMDRVGDGVIDGLTYIFFGVLFASASLALKWLNQIRWAVMSEDQKKATLASE